jgi:hypothetical protein
MLSTEREYRLGILSITQGSVITLLEVVTIWGKERMHCNGRSALFGGVHKASMKKEEGGGITLSRHQRSLPKCLDPGSHSQFEEYGLSTQIHEMGHQQTTDRHTVLAFDDFVSPVQGQTWLGPRV